jgi:hypothetical protein
MNQQNLVFLSDEKNPTEKTFTNDGKETSRFAVPLESSTFDLVLNRNPSVAGILLGDRDKPLAGHRLALGSDIEFDAHDQDMRTDIYGINTDKEGKFRI